MFLRKNSELPRKKFENKWGGEGVQQVIQILDPEELQGKGRLFTDNILPKGASVGRHDHNGDVEVYYFLEGQGLYESDEGEFPVEAGDVTLVSDQGSHGIKNVGESDLRFIALILYSKEAP